MDSATVLEWKSPPPARSEEFLAMIRWAGSWLRGLTLTSAKRNGVTLRACATFDGINVEGTHKVYGNPSPAITENTGAISSAGYDEWYLPHGYGYRTLADVRAAYRRATQ